MTTAEPITDEHEVLKQQHNAMRDLLDKSHAEGVRYKQRLEQLAHALQERDKRIAELQLFEYRLKKTAEKSQDLDIHLAQAKESIKILQEEKSTLESSLIDSQQHTKQLERVIQFLRERAETSRLELRQVQSELTSFQESALINTRQAEEKSAETDILQYQITFEKEKHEETLLELKSIQQQWPQLQQNVRNAQQQASRNQALLNSLRNEKQLLETALLAKEDAFALCEQQNRVIRSELNLLKPRYNIAVDGNVSAISKLLQLKEEMQLREAELEELYRLREIDRQEIATLKKHHQHFENCHAEKEAEIRMAQHHLAKRVKEATLLSEKNEVLRQQISELQKEAANYQNKANELQNALEQFSQTLQTTETKVGQWETKYLQIFEKWQATEARNLELSKIEEKQMQLQALLSHWTALKPTYNEREPAHVSSEQGLFEKTKPTIRFKQTLFD